MALDRRKNNITFDSARMSNEGQQAIFSTDMSVAAIGNVTRTNQGRNIHMDNFCLAIPCRPVSCRGDHRQHVVPLPIIKQQPWAFHCSGGERTDHNCTPQGPAQNRSAWTITPGHQEAYV